VQVIITEATSDGGCRALLDELHRSGLDIGLIVLTGSERSDDVLSLVQAGAAAYLHKTESFAELVCAVRTVAQGGRILDPQALEAILRDYRARCHGAAENVLCRLTTREREVLVRVADGSSTRQIADDLHMSQKTVAVHRQRIMAKLGMHKVAHLVRYAVREGLVEPE
jgi:DNA-binding NarL/FixJ family response regulator